MDTEAQFAEKILGIRNYSSEKTEFVVKDFQDLDLLHTFLIEVTTGESDLTPAGKAFLESQYGFESLAKLLAEKGGVGEYTGESAILTWLSSLSPLETMRFIEESKGSIEPGAIPREDLLPPQE